MSFTNRRPPQHVNFREASNNEGTGTMVFDGMDYADSHIPAAQDGIHIPRFVAQPLDPTLIHPMERHDFHRDAQWDKDAPSIPRFGSDLGPKKTTFAPIPPSSRAQQSTEVIPRLPVFKLG